MNNNDQELYAKAAPMPSQLDYLIERRRYNDARRLLSKELAEAPDDPDMLLYGGYIDFLEDRYDDARKTLERVLSINPHHAPARRVLFKVHRWTHRYAQAEQVVIGLLQDYPEDAGLYAEYSMLMLETQHLEKAQQLAEQALRLDPEDFEALFASAMCAFVIKPSPQNNQRLQEMIQLYPDAATTLQLMIVVLADRGRNREAHQLSQLLLQVYPDDDEVVDMVIQLKVASHWTMLPLWPMQRFGWAASGALWFLIVGTLTVLPKTPLAHWQGPISFAFIAYVIYSWVYPPLLKRFFKR